MEGWASEHYGRHPTGQSRGTKWDQHFKAKSFIQTKTICVQIFSHTVYKGSLRHRRQSPAVWSGLQLCHSAWEPCHPRDVHPQEVMVLVLHGWADTPGQRDAGRHKDTLGQAQGHLGQGHPEKLQLWVTHLGTEKRKSSEQQNVITNGSWQLCETTHCKHKQEAIEVGAKRPRIKKTCTKTWANTWAKYLCSVLF